MKNNSQWMHGVLLLFIIAVLGLALPQLRSVEPNADPQERGQTSYMPVDIKGIVLIDHVTNDGGQAGH